MRSIVASFAALLTYSQALQLSNEQASDNARFEAWAAEHNRSYQSVTERAERFANWQVKDAAYKALNANPEHTFTVALNKFADWTEAEYKSILLEAIPVDEEPLTLAEVF